MNDCTIFIDVPKKILKGAGLPASDFLPSQIYKFKIILKNNSSEKKLCSFTVTLGNGIRYLKNMHSEGPDSSLKDMIHIIEPNSYIENNNVIIFANNFILSPSSKNTITFDVALFDKLTSDSIENSGEKISHKQNIFISGHLIDGENVSSCSTMCQAYDYELNINCEDSSITPGETTKFYINCKTGQYDMVRSVYVRCILDKNIDFISDSSNLEPRNVYTFDEKTILKWDLGSLQPSEIRKIGFKVSLKDKKNINAGDIIKCKFNSNCVNNTTYTQCPSSSKYELTVQ